MAQLGQCEAGYFELGASGTAIVSFRSDGLAADTYVESLVGGKWARKFQSDGFGSDHYDARIIGTAKFQSDGTSADTYVGGFSSIPDGCLAGAGNPTSSISGGGRPRNRAY